MTSSNTNSFEGCSGLQKHAPWSAKAGRGGQINADSNTLLEPRKAIWIEKMDQLTNPGHGADFFSNFDATVLSDLVTVKGLDILTMDKDKLTGGLVKDVQLEKGLDKTLKDSLLDKHFDANKLTASKLTLNQGLS